MDNKSNSIESLIDSFKTICSTLETNAESELMDIEKQCNEDFLESVKTLQKFNETTCGIAETCLGIINAGEMLDPLTKRTNPVSALNIPYDLHSDLVNSINALYNMPPLGKGACDEKLINDRSKQLVSDLIKECERNAFDIKDIQTAVIDAKAQLNNVKYFLQ